jgi:hypothetical protein
MITLPETAVADITANAGGIFSDFWVLITILIGLILGFWIIGAIVGSFHKEDTQDLTIKK